MATVTKHPNENEVSILSRILNGPDGRMSEDLARYILSVGFSEQDQARMHELAVRNQNDDLTPAEKEELFAFVRADDILILLKSRARRTLGITLEPWQAT